MDLYPVFCQDLKWPGNFFIIALAVSTMFLEILRFRLPKTKIVFYQKREYPVNEDRILPVDFVSATIPGVFNLELMRNDCPFVSFCENALAEINIDISLI